MYFCGVFFPLCVLKSVLYVLNLFTTEFSFKITVCILYGTIITNSQAIEDLVLIGQTVLTQLVFIRVTIETIHSIQKTEFTNNATIYM